MFTIRPFSKSFNRTLSGQIKGKDVITFILKQRIMEKTTAIISIPQCVASHTLTSLGHKCIQCQYQGVDLSGRILMKIVYPSNQEIYLHKLIEEMAESEKSINLLLEIGVAILINELEKTKHFYSANH